MRDLFVQFERERLGEDVERVSLGRYPKKAGKVWRDFEEERKKLRTTLALIDRREPEALRTCVRRAVLFWRLLNSSRWQRRRFLRPLDLASPFPQWGWRANEHAPENPRRGDVWREESPARFRVWNGKRWVTWTEKTRRLVGAEDRALATCFGYAALSDYRCAQVWLRLLQLAAETLCDELVLVVDRVALPYDDTAHHALAVFFEQRRFKAGLDEAEQQEHRRLALLAEQELGRLMDRRARAIPPSAPPIPAASEVLSRNDNAAVQVAENGSLPRSANNTFRDPASADERILLAVHRAVVAGKPLTSRLAIAAASNCSKREAQRAKDIEKRDDAYHLADGVLQKLVRNHLLLPQ